MMTFKLGGVAEAIEKLTTYGVRAVEAADAALYMEGERIMTISKRLVPVDTGALRSTGQVTHPEREGTSVQVTLGYGGVAGNGENVGYALPVHENLAAHHKVGQAKYLEQPLTEETSSGRSAEAIGVFVKGSLAL